MLSFLNNVQNKGGDVLVVGGGDVNGGAMWFIGGDFFCFNL